MCCPPRRQGYRRDPAQVDTPHDALWALALGRSGKGRRRPPVQSFWPEGPIPTPALSKGSERLSKRLTAREGTSGGVRSLSAGAGCHNGFRRVVRPERESAPAPRGARPGAWRREIHSRGAGNTLERCRVTSRRSAASWPVSASRGDRPPRRGRSALELVEDREARNVLRETQKAWQDGYERRESKTRALA